ncbi:unnamed protein product [Blumeria hordei]|uniref:Uncharacterized protein n=1 Tax=Blumeria hordei TaxID=2867405 RepID=A0A383UZE3_BLUHO|nr:unnamed protein product [Blumeria hordei]
MLKRQPKDEYFNQLQALQESSEDEEEMNELRIKGQALPTPCQSPSTSNKPVSNQYLIEESQNQHCDQLVKSSDLPSVSFQVKRVSRIPGRSLQLEVEPSTVLETPNAKSPLSSPSTARSLVLETPRLLWNPRWQQHSGAKVSVLNSGKKMIRCPNQCRINTSRSGSPFVANKFASKHPSKFIQTREETRKVSMSMRKPSLTGSMDLKPDLTHHQVFPSIGSVVMKNSLGINSMLKKKNKGRPH